jgi:hypothetical protein
LPKPILELIEQRKVAKKKSKKDASFKSSFNKLTKLVNKAISDFKNKEWLRQLEKVKKTSSSKPLWNKVNMFRKNDELVPNLLSNGKWHVTPKEKADLFAEILNETFNINVNNGTDDELDNRINEFNSLLIDHFVLFDLNDLDEGIKDIKNGAAGIDGISNQMLKHLGYNFNLLLLKLFNLIVQKGEVPSDWKVSKIKMIPKKLGCSSNPSEYRPISLTSCICKLFERLIHKKIVAYLESKNLFAKCQSGFRKHRSTKDQLLFLTQKIKESLLRRKRVCAFFFDIKKAFDCLSHKALIYKMTKIEIPAYLVKIVISFLFYRSFFVTVEGENSKNYIIKNSVPQGSVLGPLLFIIFINDIPLLNDKNKSYSLLF